MNRLLKYILISTLSCIYLTVNGQTSENKFLVTLGNTKIKISEPFTIAVTLQNFETTPVIKFPEIKGFQKRDQSTTRNYSANSKTIATQTVKQNYYVNKIGEYIVTPLVVVINGQNVKTESFIINVEAAEGEQVVEAIDFTENIITNDALLIVSTDKQRIFVGEGFNLRLSLIVSESNTAEMDFYEIESQMTQILKKLKPANCWEENFGIKDIRPITVTIAGKKYGEYRIYQASFYPINAQPIVIPTANLTMKISTGTGIKRSSRFQTYSSKTLDINVLPLPPHPLKNQVSVGNFRLEESISQRGTQTGKSIYYLFKINGEGNLGSAKNPSHDSTSVFDIYPPSIDFSIIFQNKSIIEEKVYNYSIIAKQNGAYALKDVFYWVFFNPVKERYDTLRSSIKLKVGGQDIDNSQMPQTTAGSIYEGIEKLDSTKQEADYQKIIKNIANVLIILMLVGMVFIFRKNE